MHHTRNCRERIRGCLESSGDDEVLKKATSRQDEYVASQVEAAADRGGSAMLGGGGDPGSSGRGGVSQEDPGDAPEDAGAALEAAAAAAQVPDDSDLDESKDGDAATAQKASRAPETSPEDNLPSKRRKHDKDKSDEKKRKEDDIEEKDKKGKKKRKKEKDDFDAFFDDELYSGNISKTTKLWEGDWIHKNPITGSNWNIEETSVQKRFKYMLNLYEPEFLICGWRR